MYSFPISVSAWYSYVSLGWTYQPFKLPVFTTENEVGGYTICKQKVFYNVFRLSSIAETKASETSLPLINNIVSKTSLLRVSVRLQIS